MAEAKRRTFKSFLNATPVAISLYFAVIFGFLWLAYSGAQAMGYNWPVVPDVTILLPVHRGRVPVG